MSLKRSFFATKTRSDTMRGIILILLSVLSFSGVDVTSKLIVTTSPPILTNIIRYILLISSVLFLMGREHRKTLTKVTHLPTLLLRGLCQGGTGLFYLLALQTLPLSITAALYFTAPIFVVAFSPLILKEKVTKKQWFAVIIGFIGMIFILQPELALDPRGLFWVSLAMVSLIFLYLFTRKLSSSVSTWQQLFYGNTGGLILGLFALPLLNDVFIPVMPDFLIILFCMIICTLLGQFFMVKAFTCVPASVLAPFTYFQLVFALFASSLVFSESIDILTLIGVAIIICAGITAGRR